MRIEYSLNSRSILTSAISHLTSLFLSFAPMSRKRKPHPLLEKVRIESAGSKGKCIARVSLPVGLPEEGKENRDMVVFVPSVVPGDVADLQVTRKKRKFMEARAVKFYEYSKERVEPFCEHFGVCGGCKWQHMDYTHQLKYKQQEIVDNFQRLGKFEFPEVKPILPSPKTTEYRNKLEFTFCNKRWMTEEEVKSGVEFDDLNAVGFHVPQRFDRVVDVTKCHLQPEPSNAIRNSIREYAFKHDLSFFDIREQHGFLRTLLIRNNVKGETMVIVVFFHEDEEKRIGLLEHLKSEFPDLHSLMYIINEKKNDTISDQEVITYHGEDHLIEQLEDVQFKIGPKSFYQTNPLQAYELYKVAREFAGLKGDELVYDLYTGIGSIALFVAKQCKKMVGVEYVPESIENAKENAELNGITNSSFFAGDLKDVLDETFVAEHGKPDVIITDPPRAGMHADVVAQILKIAPQKIVYVSCDPSTQARDIALMDEQYKVTAVQPVDMFPHTYHVENVALLEKR